jgi:ectoine hydroxylase-related dioxygenase (phytanoyl-CoA dioxygenase family)
MDIARWGDLSTWPESEIRAIAEQIDELDLYRNIAELDMYGFTVVDASVTGARDTAQRAFERVVDLAEERTGERPDVETGLTHSSYAKSAVPCVYKFVHEDVVFQELMLHPIAVALVTYLLGQRCVLSESALFMKGPAESDERLNHLSITGKKLLLGLHSDYILRPEPFPAYAEECNLTWMLTDYSVDNGALAIVPGSHRQRRRPNAGDDVEDQLVAIEAPQGSLVLINDATWHGALPSTVPGLRAGLALRFCRPFVARREVFEDLPDDLTEGKSARFAQFMGGTVFHVQDHGDLDRAAFATWPRFPTVYS